MTVSSRSGSVKWPSYSGGDGETHCFRYRNKIGMDVVLEAMRLWRERRRKKLDVLLDYARMRHVERAMRPYLEVLS